MKMIVFRSDSGHHIGSGHIQRCLKLARELSKKYRIFFILKNHDGANYEPILKEFNAHILQDGLDSGEQPKSYKDWLGKNIEEEISFINSFANKASAIVLDHYGITSDYLEKIKIKKTIIFDDLMEHRFDADLIINANINADSKWYSNSSEKNICLGTDFYLSSKVQEESFSCIEHIQKIGVFFGASNVSSINVKFLESILIYKEKFDSYLFNIIVPEDIIQSKEILNLVEQLGNVKLYGFQKNFLQFISQNDVFIGAAGTSLYERFMLGVPNIICSVVNNQESVNMAFKERELAFSLGRIEDYNANEWSELLSSALGDLDMLNSNARNAFDLIDGRGGARIAKKIEELVCE